MSAKSAAPWVEIIAGTRVTFLDSQFTNGLAQSIPCGSDLSEI